ncbi:hypothetical protein HPULCUR_007077 [Helicostylum pulchrum]|uniref:Uncharacterized protein n=1 Tax=Helicostylum pulchrum TaxID=562976 RepID=A0ABP9Y3Q7_9FUNG
MFKQLSIRLPNSKHLSLLKIYDETYFCEDGMDINMPYTSFDKLYTERKYTIIKHCLGLFLKYSNENGDKYFYAALKPSVKSSIKPYFTESSYTEYRDKLTSRSTYFLELICQAICEFIIQFGHVNMKFLA